MAHQILNTLYVMTQNSWIHLENDTIRIDVEKEKKLQVPLHHIGSLVIFGNGMVSPALMGRCAEEGISLIYLDMNGRFKARLEGPITGNVLLRQAQYHLSENNTFSLMIARGIIAGKLKNSRTVLMRGFRESTDEQDRKTLAKASASLGYLIRSLPQSTSIDAIRGIEGDAAKIYFSSLPYIIKADFRNDFKMDGRSRRPPLDRFNALISFLYSMVMNDCRSALESIGLDPQVGFLHAIRPGRAALALDMMEEFRSSLADRLAITLINRGQINASDFIVRDGGAVALEGDSKKTVVVAYQERKQEEITHPLLEQKIPIGLIPQAQARFLARTIRGEMEMYLPFLSK